MPVISTYLRNTRDEKKTTRRKGRYIPWGREARASELVMMEVSEEMGMAYRG